MPPAASEVGCEPRRFTTASVRAPKKGGGTFHAAGAGPPGPARRGARTVAGIDPPRGILARRFWRADFGAQILAPERRGVEPVRGPVRGEARRNAVRTAVPKTASLLAIPRNDDKSRDNIPRKSSRDVIIVICTVMQSDARLLRRRAHWTGSCLEGRRRRRAPLLRIWRLDRRRGGLPFATCAAAEVTVRWRLDLTLSGGSELGELEHRFRRCKNWLYLTKSHRIAHMTEITCSGRATFSRSSASSRRSSEGEIYEK